MKNIFIKINLWFWGKYRQFRRNNYWYCRLRARIKYEWMKIKNGGSTVFDSDYWG